ncbi:Son of sevenless 2 [Castilleja foliolosa]|uniref:Son of sevenless 2 n=1 Tax=Castilleja foliolosa TaxID=1961234 RepID=A0ABD3BYU2_9LAMI
MKFVTGGELFDKTGHEKSFIQGYLPFDESDLPSLYNKINAAQFSCPFWFSPAATSLIHKILDPNPESINILSYAIRKLMHFIGTGHSANIFCIKFSPETSDELVVFGTADAEVMVTLDNKHLILPAPEKKYFYFLLIQVIMHVTSSWKPYMVWSAGQDGTLRHHDLHEGVSCPSGSSHQECRNILVRPTIHEIHNFTRSAFDFAKQMASRPANSSPRLIPVVVGFEACTVQKEGESNEAVMERAICSRRLIRYTCTHVQ